MSGTIPPIPPPFGASSGNPGSPNVNSVDTMTSNVVSRLANQDKRLKSIIIYCLPNDVMKSVIKCKTAKEMWNDLILAHGGPSDTGDTKIAALRLKFNAFKSLEGEKVNETFTRLKCFLNDLENNGVTIPQVEVNVTFVNSLPKKWLSMNQTQRTNNSIKNDSLATLYGKYNYKEGLIDHIYESDLYKDVEEDQRTNNEFKADLNAEYHKIALLANQKRFFKRIDDMTKGKKVKEKSEKGLLAESFDLDDESVSSDDEGITKIRAFMAIAEDETSVGKANARSGQWVNITMKKEPLPPLSKLIGAAPSGTLESLISLSDLTLNMADLTLDTPEPKKTRPFVKMSSAYVIKKNIEKFPVDPKQGSDKKADSPTKQLFLTLMEELKGLKRKIEIPTGTPQSSS
nr:hypothetical protein [Tanacetum cinerariifolium]